MKWIKLIRIHHWIKNLLVLFPVFFSGSFASPDYLIVGIIGCLCFSLTSSSIYIINDINDIEKDKCHPTKCKRPIPAGEIKIPSAVTIAVCFTVISFVSTYLIAESALYSLILLAAYFVLNFLYSFKLKDIPIIDVAILASGFVLRILYGGAICNIPISAWLFLTVLAFSLYFALGKRMGELKKHGSKNRRSLSSYSIDFLQNNMNIFLVCGLVFYSLWTIDQCSTVNFGSNTHDTLLIISVPIAMLALLKYSLSMYSLESDGDPVEVVVHDKILVGIMIAWCIVTALALYY